MIFTDLRTIALVLLWLLCVPLQVQALSYQPPPIQDELASPFTESEAGGLGCIVASLAVGGGMVYLLGGFQPIVATLAAHMPAGRILEGSAAVAFVFSSSCYIGAVLAPITMATYTAIADGMAPVVMPKRPLFVPSATSGRGTTEAVPHLPQNSAPAASLAP
jgi:hypothetical protein